MSEWRRIGEIEAASGTTHLLASTLVRGQTFHVMRTPSMPSGSMFAISAIRSVGGIIELWRVRKERLYHWWGLKPFGVDRWWIWWCLCSGLGQRFFSFYTSSSNRYSYQNLRTEQWCSFPNQTNWYREIGYLYYFGLYIFELIFCLIKPYILTLKFWFIKYKIM